MTTLLEELEQDFLGALRQALELHCKDWDVDDEELNVLEGFRQTLRLASAGHLQFLESDPDYPLLIKNQSLQRQMQLPAADAVYHWSKINGRNRYRIRGNRGSAHVFQVAVYAGSSSRYPDFKIVSTRDNWDSPSLAPNKDIDLTLSRDGEGDNWLELPEGDGELFIRQYYYDWDSEQPANLWIEREDAPYPPPPLSAKNLQQGAADLTSWLRVQSNVYRQYVEACVTSKTSAQSPDAISIPGAFEGVWYLNGHYKCAQDEAVILEVGPTDAPFWGFQLSNLQWEALDYYQRKTSINGHQAALDEDGMFRAVISHQDPGVLNWLDAGGRSRGLISGRYFKASSPPKTRLQTVPLNALQSHLPRATKAVTPRQRHEELRRRLISAHRRFCSDQ